MFRKTGPGVILLLVAPAFGFQDSAKDQAKISAAAQQYQAILKEYKAEVQAWQKGWQEAKTNEEKQKLRFPQPRKFAPKMMAVAEKHPKDPAAVDALVWVAMNDRSMSPSKLRAKALELLEHDHIKSDKLGQLCQMLGYDNSKEGEEFLRALIDKNPHRTVQGMACLSLATMLKNRASSTKDAKAERISSLNKEAEELLERAAEKYGDVKLPFRGTIGDRAKGELFEIRYLAVGKTPPDIKGKDQDDVAFKLTDYRGKVVLLDFWGNW